MLVRKGLTRLSAAVAVLVVGLGLVVAATPALADPGRPTVTNVAPNAGLPAGGNQVVITGTGLGDVTSVLFGTARGTSITLGTPSGARHISLTVVAPKHAPGRTDIRVVTANGTSAVVANLARYTYIAAPRALTVDAPKTIDDNDRSITLAAVSCPTSSFCAAFDTNGLAVMKVGGTWRAPTEIEDQVGTIDDVSCATTAFCIATDTLGNAYQWDGASWTDTTNIGGGPDSVSCVSPTFCEAVIVSGRATTFNGVSWSTPTFINSDEITMLTSVSCASTTFCYAAGNMSESGRGGLQHGIVISFVDGTWADPQIFMSSRERLSVMSCPTVHFCAVGDNNGVRVWTGQAQVPDVEPIGWSADIRLHGNEGGATLTSAVDCTNATFCVAYWQDSTDHIKHWARFDGASDAAQTFTVRHAGSFPVTGSCWARFDCQFVGGSDAYRTS